MGTKENGKGAMAWGVILTVLLAMANVIGGYVWKSVNDSSKRIVEIDYQLREMQSKLDSATKSRWTAANQVQYNRELNSLNASLRVPDVRQILKENE